MIQKHQVAGWVEPLARTGLIAKGVVYCLLGLLAFMAAFELGGRSAGNTDKAGVISFLKEHTGGTLILIAIAAGLLCFSVWRIVQSIVDTSREGNSAKGLAKRGRYLFSGLVYLSLTLLTVRSAFGQSKSSGNNSNEDVASTILEQPMGQWLLGIVAFAFAAVGIYQIYYGLSEKFKKLVSEKDITQKAGRMLLRSGKIGYIARGIVWLIIAYFFLQAAMQGQSSEAGDTAQAFAFLKDSSYGAYLLGAVGFGLICYGIFNLLRGRYENFS